MWRILSTGLPLLSSHSGSSTFSARLEADAFCGFSINPRTARPTATPFPPPRTKLFVPSQRSLCEHFHFHLHHPSFAWGKCIDETKKLREKIGFDPNVVHLHQGRKWLGLLWSSFPFIVSKPGADCWVVEAAAPLYTLRPLCPLLPATVHRLWYQLPPGSSPCRWLAIRLSLCNNCAMQCSCCQHDDL